jgi:hypothetical protein
MDSGIRDGAVADMKRFSWSFPDIRSCTVILIVLTRLVSVYNTSSTSQSLEGVGSTFESTFESTCSCGRASRGTSASSASTKIHISCAALLKPPLPTRPTGR